MSLRTTLKNLQALNPLVRPTGAATLAGLTMTLIARFCSLCHLICGRVAHEGPIMETPPRGDQALQSVQSRPMPSNSCVAAATSHHLSSALKTRACAGATVEVPLKARASCVRRKGVKITADCSMCPAQSPRVHSSDQGRVGPVDGDGDCANRGRGGIQFAFADSSAQRLLGPGLC